MLLCCSCAAAAAATTALVASLCSRTVDKCKGWHTRPDAERGSGKRKPAASDSLFGGDCFLFWVVSVPEGLLSGSHCREKWREEEK